MIAAAACTVLWAAIAFKCADTGHPILAALALLIGVFPLWMAMPFQKAPDIPGHEPELPQAEKPNNVVRFGVFQPDEGDLIVIKVRADQLQKPQPYIDLANAWSSAYREKRVVVAVIPDHVDIGLVRGPEVDATLEALRNLIQPEA